LQLVEKSLTLVSTYCTYLVKEHLGDSEVIRIVTTALILGDFSSRIGMKPRTQIIITEFWELSALSMSSIIFY
jgi:CPA1 family monovalent cation:H+ antiporter